MLYQAIINTPGYLPESDIPFFDTIKEAWEHLAAERARAFEGLDLPEIVIDGLDQLTAQDQCGVVYLGTPGYDGDHDLGEAYSVVAHECSFTRWRAPDGTGWLSVCAVCGHADYPHTIGDLPGCPGCDQEW